MRYLTGTELLKIVRLELKPEAYDVSKMAKEILEFRNPVKGETWTHLSEDLAVKITKDDVNGSRDGFLIDDFDQKVWLMQKDIPEFISWLAEQDFDTK